MNYKDQIIDAFEASKIKRILIVDDAYDAPGFNKLNEKFAGGLLEILSGPALREHLDEEALSDEDLRAAIEALNQSEFSDFALTTAIKVLYGEYLRTRENALDPRGFFNGKKDELKSLDPLLELLCLCIDESKIKTVGIGDAAIQAYREFRPDLILMDFFLSPPERTMHETTGLKDSDWKRASIDLLKKILSEKLRPPLPTPAVILVSSKNVGNSKEIYLSRLKGRVMALRFGFLHKGWVHRDRQDLIAEGDAADVLMDTSGSFGFGAALEVALNTWKEGAEKALDQLHRDLHEFDVKDFAYLLRFRLYNEGVPFADYLEWLLGESLRAIVDEKVNWKNDAFSNLNKKKLTQAIEGAHPLPSVRIAEFYHRMRFNKWENRPRKRIAFGDLFVASNNAEKHGKINVRMVISPDCDLVPRESKTNAKRKTKATRILTIGGEILGLKEDLAWASELIFYNDAPKAIKWNFKDLMTHKFEDENTTTFEVDDTPYEFFASMHPMYAQAIQKQVLADLSRIGTPVPPTVGASFPVRVFLNKNIGNQAKADELKDLSSEARAQVFMPRGGGDKKDKMYALFTQKFVRDLIAKVEETKKDDLALDHQKCRLKFISEKKQVRINMLRDGLQLPSDDFFKLSIGNEKSKKQGWLEIAIDVSNDAKIHLHGIDPLNQERTP